MQRVQSQAGGTEQPGVASQRKLRERGDRGGMEGNERKQIKSVACKLLKDEEEQKINK